MTLRFLELFAGAGGMSLGLEAAGLECVGHAEIEPHARAVLRKVWRDVPLYGDVTTLDGAALMAAHPFDVLTGGSPCQDLSVAGKRAGLSGSRSSLFHVQHRLWMESGAPYLLWENVAGAFSSNGGADFATVLSTLVGAAIPVPEDGWEPSGVAAGPEAVAAWRVLDLQYVPGRDRAAPPQRRVRVFVLAARSGGVDPAEVLALGESVCGHPAPRRRAGEGAAGDSAGGVRGGGAVGWDDECNAADVMGTLVRPPEAGGHRRAGVLAFHLTQDPINGEESPALGTTSAGMGVVCVTGDTTHALTHEGADASEDGTGRGTPIVLASGQANAEAVQGGAPSLTCLHEAPIVGGVGRPRRLTPLECERLMAWPDGHTAVGIDENGREYRLSDTARYRLCGNGIGSTCAEWIGRRLVALEYAAGPRSS